MVISLGWLSPATSRGLPAAQTTRAGSRCLLGLAPTGGCRATPVAGARWALTPPFHPYPWIKGGLFSVARSVALRRPGVTWQSALWSSDFPQRAMKPTHRDHHALPPPRGKGIGLGRVGATLSAPAVSTGEPGCRPGVVRRSSPPQPPRGARSHRCLRTPCVSDPPSHGSAAAPARA